MRLGYIKDENGKLVRKWVKQGEEGKDPDVLYQVATQFGEYLWTDEEHMEEAKKALLESMFDCIRNLAKIDKFWIVKHVDKNDPLSTLGCPMDNKDNAATVAWKISFPQMEGYFKWDEAEKLKKQLEECGGHL